MRAWMKFFQTKATVSQKTESRNDVIGLNKKVLSFLGMWPTTGREPRNLRFYLRYFYPRVQPIRMVYGVLCQMINISIVWGDTTRIVEFTAALVFQVITLVRFVTLFNQRDKIKEMCDTIERLSDTKMMADDNMKKILSSTQRLSNQLTSGCLNTVAFMLTVNGVVTAFQALATRKIPLRLWYPYDVRPTPIFEITTCFTLITTAVEGVVISVCDLIFIVLMIQAIGQFKLLNYKLLNIRRLAAHKIERNKSRKKDISSIAHALRSAFKRKENCGEVGPAAKTIGRRWEAGQPGRERTSLNIPGCVQEVRRGRESGQQTSHQGGGDAHSDVKTSSETSSQLKSQQGSGDVDSNVKTSTETDKLEANLEMDRLIKECAQKHQELLRLVRDLEVAFKVMLLQQIMFNAVGGFVVLYITTLATSIDATVIAFLCALSGFYYEFFLFCWFGHKVTEEGLKVRDAVYDCDWFGASVSFKRCMRIMISRTNKPLVIKAGGLPLSVTTCRLICRASYYFHTVLGKMFHGEKILKNRDV